MDNLELPEILAKVPPKLLSLITSINKYRYFLIEGGRGGAKSHTIARLLLYCAEKLKLRIVCGREIQNTIQESVYTLFSELINQYNLFFEVLATKIIHRETKTIFNFRGFREQGAINIQGMEGVDIVWIDEAQAITKITLDALIPTIRKEKAKIFFSMNRYIPDDPVYKFCSGRPDCLHIKINYLENPNCPEALKHEAEECLMKSEDDYKHIWLGEPLPQADNALLSEELVKSAVKLSFSDEGTSRIILASDIARFGEDETVFIIIKSRGLLRWEQIFQDVRKGWDLMQTTGYLLDLKRQFKPDTVVIDDIGVGGGVTDRLREQKHPPVPFIANEKSQNEAYENQRAEGYFLLKDYFLKGYLKIKNDNELITQLLSVKYKYKSNGKKAIFSKDEMRKEGLKSPDRADALMMAISQTIKIFRRQLYPIDNLPRESESEYSILTH